MTICAMNKLYEIRRALLSSTVLAGLLVCGCLLMPNQTDAQSSNQNLRLVNPQERSLITRELMSSKQAAQIAMRRIGGGRVIDVRPLGSNEAGYRVKLFKEGMVRTVIVRD
ncbi:MAG: hypothetical protein HOM55_03590 [Proteobacteria bacterium]|jgi:hypothetical protein|nr:hypothetical protein [Pseudomonadota bacterium]